MAAKNIETKGDLDQRCRKQPLNLLLDVIKESVPKVHILKADRANIRISLWELYHEYWATLMVN